MTLPSALVALALAAEAPLVDGTPPPSASARGAVSAFLESDFQGAKLRGDLIWVKGIERLVEPTWDPIVAVSGPCAIERLSERGGSATAAVICRRVAVRSTAGGELRPDRRDDGFTLRVERRSGRWAVATPPLARVSVDVLLELHRLDAAPAADERWRAGASGEQRAGLARLQRAISLLAEAGKP